MKIEITKDSKCFISFEEPKRTFKAGDIVEIHPLKAEKMIAANLAKKFEEKKERKKRKSKVGKEVENKVLNIDENK